MTRGVIYHTDTVILGTTPEKAFWFSISPGQLPKVDPAVVFWEPDELPPRVGTKNRFKLTVFGVPVHCVSRFTEFEVPKRTSLVGERPFFAKWTTLSCEVEPLGEDRTVFTARTQITYPRFAKPIAKIMLRVMRQRLAVTNAAAAERFRKSERAS